MGASGLSNWAGNIVFGAPRVHRPRSLEELRHVVAGADRVHALGTAHSFNDIADTTGELISVADLPATVEIDPATATARVAAGLRYGEVATRLHAQGWALANLGSLPHISIAGACATGTHGSGDGNGNLATEVVSVELVTADGSQETVAHPAYPVGLGAFGVVTHLTLRLRPTFEIQQYVYDNAPLPLTPTSVADVFGAAYSVSVFTNWVGRHQFWLKRLAGTDAPPRTLLGATLADGPRHPIATMPADNCTEQLGVPGPWHERLPHFRLGFTPSAGDELQSEYLVPREVAAEAVTAVAAIGERIAPVLQVSELRTVAADELWLSPSYRRDSLAIHFTWISDAARVLPAVAAVEQRLAPLGARPHWGKVFTMRPDDLRDRYPRFDEWVGLVRRNDPSGTFSNRWLDSLLQAGPASHR